MKYSIHNTHLYVRDEETGCKWVVPYGKSQVLQFFYIYNPFQYFKYAYKWRSSVRMRRSNCLWYEKAGKSLHPLKLKKSWEVRE